MGERQFENEGNGKKYHRGECAHGRFGRSFSFPEDASPAKLSAEFKGGVLTVHPARTKKAQPQQIAVKVARERARCGTGEAARPLHSSDSEA